MANKEFEKILVPFDSSEYSKRAVTKAISIGKKFNSEIIFITAVSAESVPSPSQSLGIFKKDKKLEKIFHEMICTIRIEITKMLKEQIAKCKKNGIKGDYKIMEGDAVKSILQFAKKYRPDLIVLGSHGLTGLSKIKALGSVSRNISELAKCPVMIVK